MASRTELEIDEDDGQRLSDRLYRPHVERAQGEFG
jgi:hypothetical protein